MKFLQRTGLGIASLALLVVTTADAGPRHRQAARSHARTSTRTPARTSVNHHHHHRAGRPAVRTAAAFTAGAAIGSAYSGIPSGCSSINVGGQRYYNCDGTYLEPQYQGSDVTYVVVTPPQ